MRKDREPEYHTRPVDADPILIDVGMDVRIHLRLDLREFLRRYDLDPQSGEPSPEELQVHVLCCLMQYLKGQPYLIDTDIKFLDDAIL